MSGPIVQMPTAFSNITDGGIVRPEWAAYLTSLQQIALNGTRNGTTGARPTDTMQGRWVGMPFFDTTLGKPIWLQSVNPDVWVDATGAVV